MLDQIELLHIIEKNARLTADEIAVLMGVAADEVKAAIDQLTADKIIMGYTTCIDWDKKYPDKVTAMIEVRITPVRNQGFDNIANLLSQYDKVTACYLMSGGFDLMLIYEDDNLKSIASFVYEKVATMEGVLSTATHFILRKYKDNGIIYEIPSSDDRQAIVL